METSTIGNTGKPVRTPQTLLYSMVSGIDTLERITRMNIKFGKPDNVVGNELPSKHTIPGNELGCFSYLPSSVRNTFTHIPQSERLDILQKFMSESKNFNNENEAEGCLITLTEEYQKKNSIQNKLNDSILNFINKP